jgi:hypothetical protein
VLWSRSRPHEQQILRDIEQSFRVLDVIEVRWSSDHFADNLTRFYGQSLPPGSDKERECGTGPFLLVVVEDLQPRYHRRRVTRGHARVNDAMTDAKERYRTWTGGGHAVHATADSAEFAHDLFLLLGEGVDRYADAPDWDGRARTMTRDLVGSDGWDDVTQLLTALEVTLPVVVTGSGTPSAALEIVVDDLWWAQHIAKAVPIEGDRHEVVVGGRPVPLQIHAAAADRTDNSFVEANDSRLRRLSRSLLRRARP